MRKMIHTKNAKGLKKVVPKLILNETECQQ